MSQQVIEPNRTDDTEKSVQERQKQLPSSLVVVLLVMLGAGLFVGTYLLLVFVLLECFEDIPTIPAWIPILIVVLDILWVVLIKFYPIGHRAKVISKIVVLSVSTGALLAILWGGDYQFNKPGTAGLLKKSPYSAVYIIRIGG